MGTRVLSGFTIIETVLFLGITGLLVLGVMIGVGANVNVQRYRDATETFKSVIQSQYADVTNVQNGRSAQQQCNSAAGVVDNPSGAARGQSDCMIIGKYVRIVKNKISAYTVLGREKANVTPSDTKDITLLKQKYTLNISRTEVVEKTMEWGTEIARPIVSGVTAGRTPRSIAMLILRSPDSGQVYTFWTNTVPSDADIENLSVTTAPSFLTNMIVAGTTTPGQAAQTLCIESSGLFNQGQMALYIAPYAASTSAVELVSKETLAGKGLPYSC